MTFGITSDVPDVSFSKSNLYIDEWKIIKKMQTVTYFFTDKKIEKSLKEVFNKFSKKIGLTHGAVVVNKKKSEYIDYTTIMKCDITVSSSNLIVFENRKIKNKKNRCAIFYIKDMNMVLDVLAIINKYKSDPKKMGKYSKKIELNKFVNSFCNKKSICYEYKNSVDNLMNMVFERMIR